MVLDQGVYKIKNIQSGYMLDLSGNVAFEGATIQVYPDNGTTAQQWVVRDQTQKGADDGGSTIQSNNPGSEGFGFFAAKKQDSGQRILYTRLAWSVTLVDGDNDVYRISFTRGSKNLVLSYFELEDPAVRLANHNDDDPKQQWQFIHI